MPEGEKGVRRRKSPKNERKRANGERERPEGERERAQICTKQG